MSLLDYEEKKEEPTPQVGAMCPKCVSSRRRNTGKMQIKQGSYGQFLGCTRYPVCVFTCDKPTSLNKEASVLLKEKTKRKTRRGKKKKKHKNAKWRREYAQALEQQNQMKRDFERLIR